MAFRTQHCLVRRRTQLIDALRGHLADFRLVAPKGPASLKVLETALAVETRVPPIQVGEMRAVRLEPIARLTEVIAPLADEPETAAKTETQLRRPCTIPGSVPPSPASWLPSHRIPIRWTAGATSPHGLACGPSLGRIAFRPALAQQRSTDGKSRLGSVSKMHQTDIRRRVVRKGTSTNRWLAAPVAREPNMVAPDAPANKMARMIWAMTK